MNRFHIARSLLSTLALLGIAAGWSPSILAEPATQASPTFTMQPIGWVRKTGGKTFIALSEVDVVAVRDNVIEIDAIDAFAGTPVLDLKP